MRDVRSHLIETEFDMKAFNCLNFLNYCLFHISKLWDYELAETLTRFKISCAMVIFEKFVEASFFCVHRNQFHASGKTNFCCILVRQLLNLKNHTLAIFLLI